ncbi:PAS domain-containing sensor histidine kinase [Pseudoduganella aquatica]|uniref:histidine kinase n=1 Tax=Pseudoduganella aquatica TaxID=2660641 RepID=A0A7X4HIT6_9BURK|nr:histidine kinase [Pseudoduganella aquatica]MYN10955.1 PAS domain S-box protein [Pseudoduganella aquatica]
MSGGKHPSDQLRQWQALQLSKIELDLQQQALTALQESSDQAQAGQALYQQLFELSPACSYALDEAGCVVSANQAGAALLGLSAAALKGQPFERYLAPEQQPRWRAFAAILLGSSGRAGMESQLFDGIPGAGAVRIEARFDAASGLCCIVLAPQGAVAVASQVSIQVAAEVAERTAELERDNAQLRLLGEHVANLEETVRQEMARAVHDDVAQNLLALRLDAVLLNKRSLAHPGPLRERTGAALETIDITLRSVRAILNQLRPAVLELGLQASMDWQLAEFRKRSGLACTLDVPDEQVFDCLDGGASLMLFRQLQAVLDSVQRDGGASAVAVSLRRSGGSGVQMMLTDDGAGDAGSGGGVPVSGRRQRQALAMLGVGERLRAHGGTLDVVYGAGQGCRVSMRLPGRNS